MGNPWPSTVGLAISAAYWLLVLMLILSGFGIGMLAFARAKVAPSGTGIVAMGWFVPLAMGIGAAFTGRSLWAVVLPCAAIMVAIWWLHNISRRE